MKKLLLPILFLFAFSHTSYSQFSFEKRIEFTQEDGFIQESLFEFGKQGFLLRSEKETLHNFMRVWKYEQYNTDLEPLDSKEVFLPPKHNVSQNFVGDERVHTLFRNKQGAYSLISFHAVTFNKTEVTGKLPRKAYIQEMVVLGDIAYLRGRLRKYPFMCSINWKTGEKKILPLGFEFLDQKDVYLENLQVLSATQEVFLYVKIYLQKRKTDTHILRFNLHGEKEVSMYLSQGLPDNITHASASSLGGGKYIFTGTYSSTSANQSEGLYFCQWEDGKRSSMQFYDFLEMDNFLSYLSPRRIDRLERKKARKERLGKAFTVNYHIAAHEVVPLEDGYLFIGEAYYPTETCYTYTNICPDGTTTTEIVTEFDGFQYTHAVVAKFDARSNLLWDESFELWPAYKPFYVKRFISVAEKSDTFLKLAFSSRNKLYSKYIHFDTPSLQYEEEEIIPTPYEGDLSKRSFSHIDPWYDTYFIAYGRQKIKNKVEPSVQAKRKVYFVSKFELE